MSDPYGKTPRTGGRAPGHASGIGGSHPPSLPVGLGNGADDAPPPKPVPALFDLRLIIGALFTLYGIVLIVAGITDGKPEVAKASGIRINLWAGIGMLVLGLLFLLWMSLTGDGHDRPGGEPVTADEEAGRRPA